MNENLKNNALEASNQSAVIDQLAAKLGYTIRDKHPTLVLCKEGYDDEQYPTAEAPEQRLRNESVAILTHARLSWMPGERRTQNRKSANLGRNP